MENPSLKSIFLVIGGAVAGYFIGSTIGVIMGVLFWMLVALVSGEFVFYSTSSVIANSFFSMLIGILLSVLGVISIRRLFGNNTSYFIWGTAGLTIGLVVMFSYGTNIIFHPEIYGEYNYITPFSRRDSLDQNLETLIPPRIISQVYYGAGTGQLIGSYLGTLMGLWISFSETIIKKRKAEDKKEFGEYSDFLKERLKK